MICSDKSIPNPEGTACICNKGFYMNQGTCMPIPACPLEAIWKPEYSKCECIDFQKVIINGQCVRVYCYGPNEVNIGNGRCEC